MTEYVVGFLFSTGMGQLVLIEKKRPEWQAGKCNGVGGKVELGETDHEAMVREFREETGKEILEWTRFCTLYCAHAQVSFFYTIDEHFNRVESITDEDVMLWDLDFVMDPKRTEVIPNLRWLIQMARSFSLGEGAKEFKVYEVYGDTNIETTAPVN
jgi:8-oxo-dGTP diphosphatase